MDNSVNIPKIRFPEFTGTWEKRKLNEYLVVSKEKNKDEIYKKDEVLSVSRDYGVINQIELQGRSFAGASVALYGVVKTGDVVYTKSPLKANPYGIIKTNKGKNGIVSTLYAIYKPLDNTDPNFIQVYFEQDTRMNNYMHPLVNKGAKNDMKVPDESALRGEVIFPLKGEQTKISEFFTKLDNLMALHKHKIDEIKKVRQFMFQKMFPRGDEIIPDIRFPEFDGEWEKKKVGELLVERNELAPMSDEYPLMAFIANEGVAPKGERYDRSALVNDIEGKLYKKTKFGDFIYSSNNLETGSIGLNKYGKASISPVYSIFHATGIANPDFIGHRFVRKDFINSMVKWRQGVIYGQWRIHESDFIKMEVAVPSMEEQQKIGEFLNQFDNLIALHQRNYEKYRKLKAGLLQQMFV